VIKTSKGLNLPISGTPDPIISDTPNVTSVSLLANDFVGMKPTMMVKVGDIVKRGTKLFEDKKNPGIFFTSPAGGTVKDINRGDKRKFLSVEVEVSENEDAEYFEYENTSEGLTELLINTGLWNAFRTRPFNRTPKVGSLPDAVFVNACDTNPLSVDPYFIIDQDRDDFKNGLEALTRLFSCPIHCTYQNNNFEINVDKINYCQVSGPHPAGLSSTHISQLYPVSINKIAWTINYQDIISLGYLLKNKSLRTHKIIALGGPSVFKPSLISARISGNIDQLTAGKIDNNSRVVSGSLIYGHASEGIMNYLGFYDSIISAIPDEANDIFLNWLMPGSNLHSKLNVFSSSLLKPNKFTFNVSLNGGDRAIVPVGSYDEILPMDILVPQLLKALVVGDIEQAVELGMLELAPEDLALASYICPSKYDYCSILANNLNNLYLEQ
jgi:Na+-transporting NADH:ubiquinone oxidoreductase subunit A